MNRAMKKGKRKRPSPAVNMPSGEPGDDEKGGSAGS